MPMVQVMGAEERVCHVFRPWTEEDVRQNMAHLPNVEASGKKLAEAVESFCEEFAPTFPELKRLLTQKMGSVNYVKVKDRLGGDYRMVKPGWSEPENDVYRMAGGRLADGIRERFPRKCDAAQVSACTQEEGEKVETYLNRLTNVFNEFSGMTQPAQLGDSASMWEQQLCSAFRRGVLPAHSKPERREARAEEEEKMKRDSHKASITPMKHIADFPRRPNRGNNNRRRCDTDRETCHLCGRTGHWAKQC